MNISLRFAQVYQLEQKFFSHSGTNFTKIIELICKRFRSHFPWLFIILYGTLFVLLVENEVTGLLTVSLFFAVQ